MKKVKTFGTVLKRFQQDAVNNGTSVLTTCLRELSRVNQGAKNADETRRNIISDVGALLFEAPTGTGKTLMAGHVAENLSLLHNTTGLQKVIWFWFAPFSGLIDQTIRTIKNEFNSLRSKDLIVDRELHDLKSGDVFVTTWASVAVSNEASRKARVGSEVLPSIDDLVKFARSQGYVIGVIIDEAHHSFRGQTQAFAFYKDVLSPELTILVTATPRDKDVDAFKRATGITNLRRIAVSRQQAIDDRLIKEGVKVAVFKAPTDVESLIDYKRTALKQGVLTHNRIKKALSDNEQSVVPLLLVQVDSEPNSVEQAVAWLQEMGFRTVGENGLIRTHTADEPDPFLSIIASDETVEVLIFKMAVATGFDAPRAFTLVSFRPNRDDDFGVQIVGRILRVDRRLQLIKELPAELNYGYVFLSNNASQTGLTNAAQRINQVKTELASVTSNVAVVSVENLSMEIKEDGEKSFLTYLDYYSESSSKIENNEQTHDEKISMFPLTGNDTSQDNTGDSTMYNPDDDCESKSHNSNEKIENSVLSNSNPYKDTSSDSNQNKYEQAYFNREIRTSDEFCFQDELFKGWGLKQNTNNDNSEPGNNKKHQGVYRYKLNEKLGSPKVFRRAVLSLNNIDIVRFIVSRFRFDEDALLVATQSATKIIMEEVEIFQNLKNRPSEIRADLAQKEIDQRAQTTLFSADDFDVIDVRELHSALTQQFKKEIERKGIDHLFQTDEQVRAGLHKILALRPQQLKRAISETVAQFTESKETEEPIPMEIASWEPLELARLNIYGVFPDDLNSWELPFARYLDDDMTDTVLWWHRNPVRKRFSVTMPLPGQPDFYPDFIVGIKDRIHGNGILLMETKRVINDQERNAIIKAQAVHPDYGKVMMIYWEAKREWKVVEYDPQTDKNFLDRVLRPELMITY